MPENCDAACVKNIIDTGGRLPRAARFYADAAEEYARAYQAARLNERLPSQQLDRLHALAELDCRRAAQLIKWAEQIHKRGIDELAGGEYHGDFEVVGIETIRKKE